MRPILFGCVLCGTAGCTIPPPDSFEPRILRGADVLWKTRILEASEICGFVFEEVTVQSTGLTVDGPSGPVEGAILINELHLDLAREDKVLAPGYGEFATGAGANRENVALAVPADALPGIPPIELSTLFVGAQDAFDDVPEGDWDDLEGEVDSMIGAWEDYKAAGVPPLLGAQMAEALEGLEDAVQAQDIAEVRQAAVGVSRATLDFQLRYRPPTEVDLSRFKLWVKQILVDAAADDPAGVQDDVTVLEWSRARFAHTLSSSLRGQIDALVGELRAAADEEDLAEAADLARELQELLSGA